MGQPERDGVAGSGGVLGETVPAQRAVDDMGAGQDEPFGDQHPRDGVVAMAYGDEGLLERVSGACACASRGRPAGLPRAAAEIPGGRDLEARVSLAGEHPEARSEPRVTPNSTVTASGRWLPLEIERWIWPSTPPSGRRASSRTSPPRVSARLIRLSTLTGWAEPNSSGSSNSPSASDCCRPPPDGGCAPDCSCAPGRRVAAGSSARSHTTVASSILRATSPMPLSLTRAARPPPALLPPIFRFRTRSHLRKGDGSGIRGGALPLEDGARQLPGLGDVPPPGARGRGTSGAGGHTGGADGGIGGVRADGSVGPSGLWFESGPGPDPYVTP